ncbi:MAG: DUF4097 family beta strand repeat-containing protein [candidate division WOR-3 bacterium]
MKNNLKKLFLAIFLPVLILSSLPAESSYDYKTEFRKTYKVKPGTQITVSSRNGTTNIEAWDKKEVEVFAVIGSNKSMKELAKVGVEVTIDDKEMEIETVYSEKFKENEDSDFGIWEFLKWVLKGEFTGNRVNVDYEIKVPEHVVISEVNTTNGKVFLKGTKGPSLLHTTNGEIKVEKAKGDIEARSTNGKIVIENVDGFVAAYTTNGYIKAKSEKMKELRTTNGNFEAEFKEMKEGGVKLRTTNGSITISLPASLNTILELRTTNGGIDAGDIAMERLQGSPFVAATAAYLHCQFG